MWRNFMRSPRRAGARCVDSVKQTVLKHTLHTISQWVRRKNEFPSPKPVLCVTVSQVSYEKIHSTNTPRVLAADIFFTEKNLRAHQRLEGRRARPCWQCKF